MIATVDDSFAIGDDNAFYSAFTLKGCCSAGCLRHGKIHVRQLRSEFFKRALYPQKITVNAIFVILSTHLHRVTAKLAKFKIIHHLLPGQLAKKNSKKKFVVNLDV